MIQESNIPKGFKVTVERLIWHCIYYYVRKDNATSWRRKISDAFSQKKKTQKKISDAFVVRKYRNREANWRDKENVWKNGKGLYMAG